LRAATSICAATATFCDTDCDVTPFEDVDLPKVIVVDDDRWFNFLEDFPTVSKEQAVAALEQAKEALLASARPAR
jgi:hypothetical protein